MCCGSSNARPIESGSRRHRSAARTRPPPLRKFRCTAIKPPGGGIKRKHPHFLGKLGEQGEVMLGEESRGREKRNNPWKKVTRGARREASGKRQETRNTRQEVCTRGVRLALLHCVSEPPASLEATRRRYAPVRLSESDPRRTLSLIRGKSLSPRSHG